MRVMELMNDFRTLQLHISSLISRREANPSDTQSTCLDGYVVLRQCASESQAILALHFNLGSIGLQEGTFPQTEVQKATLQRYSYPKGCRGNDNTNAVQNYVGCIHAEVSGPQNLSAGICCNAMGADALAGAKRRKAECETY